MLDISEIITIFDGDMERVEDLVNEMIKDSPLKLSLLRRHIANAEYEELKNTAHTLKGSLLSFQFKTAALLACELEQKGRMKVLEGAEELLLRLEEEMERFKVYFSDPAWKEHSKNR